MNRVVWLSLAGALSMCAGCEEKTPAPGTTRAPDSSAANGLSGAADKIGGAMESAKEKAAETFTTLRDNAVTAMEPRMADARTQVSSLKDRFAGLPAAVKPTVESGLTEIERQLGLAEEQYDKLKVAGADAWETMSRELGVTMDKLTTSIKDLTGKMPG